jgi:hypothetical protein
LRDLGRQRGFSEVSEGSLGRGLGGNREAGREGVEGSLGRQGGSLGRQGGGFRQARRMFGEARRGEGRSKEGG